MINLKPGLFEFLQNLEATKPLNLLLCFILCIFWTTCFSFMFFYLCNTFLCLLATINFCFKTLTLNLVFFNFCQTLFLCIKLQIMLTISIDWSTFQDQLGVEGFGLDPLVTQHNDYEILTSKRPTKAPHKDKTPRYIVDYFHLKYLTSSYNYHFMLYNWD